MMQGRNGTCDDAHQRRPLPNLIPLPQCHVQRRPFRQRCGSRVLPSRPAVCGQLRATIKAEPSRPTASPHQFITKARVMRAGACCGSNWGRRTRTGKHQRGKTGCLMHELDATCKIRARRLAKGYRHPQESPTAPNQVCTTGRIAQPASTGPNEKQHQQKPKADAFQHKARRSALVLMIARSFWEGKKNRISGQGCPRQRFSAGDAPDRPILPNHPRYPRLSVQNADGR